MTKINRPMLPKKASELIRVALEDLKAAEKSKQYEINMNFYYHPRMVWDEDAKKMVPSGKCSVCFAGAVMARANPLGPNACDLDPDDFPASDRDRLFALDYFRDGAVAAGLDSMGVDPYQPKYMFLPHEIPSARYENSPRQFKKDMTRLADYLESLGL